VKSNVASARSSHGASSRAAAAVSELSQGDARLAKALERYVNVCETGTPPDRDEFLADYPEIATELAECLDGLALVNAAAGDLRQAQRSETLIAGEELKLPLGDFRIVREIGRGGMGIVYEAVQLSLGRRVALKVLPLAAALDPKHLQRFKNEAQAAAQLHHTNIVPVYAVGSERGVHYYSMQLIDGYSLADLITHRRQLLGKTIAIPPLAGEPPTEKASGRRELPAKRLDPTSDFSPTPPPFAPPPFAPPPFAPTSASGSSEQCDPLDVASNPESPPTARELDTFVHSSTFKTASERNANAYFRTAAGLIRQAALALDHAHQLGVVHRDIKPANLLLDDRGNLWVTDFGLALFQANLQLTRTGDMLGTMRYMSPEQASGDRVVLDHRTDIYSLGLTLYELLTLQPAVAGDEPHAVLRRIMDEEPRPLRAIEKTIPLELETIVLKSIAKAPSERYASAAAMAEDLQRWLNDEPIRARRPTLIEHAARWSRRHWSLLAAAAGILAVATLGLLVATISISVERTAALWALQGESQQRAAAEKHRRAEQEQRQAADESFRQARQAVDTFWNLSEEELAGHRGLAQLRRRFLATALDYYNDFLEQRRNDPAVATELAQTKQRVAKIVDELAAIDQLASLLLLGDPLVQDEISLTDAQRLALTSVIDAAKSDAAKSDAEQQPLAASGASEKENLPQQVRELSSMVDSVLSAKQAARWHQLALQQRGPIAFKDLHVVAALALTSDQRKQINRIIEEESPDRKRRAAGEPPPPPPEGPGLPREFRGPEFDGADDFGKGPPPPGNDHRPGGKGNGPPFGGPGMAGKGGPGKKMPEPRGHEWDDPHDKGGKAQRGGKGGGFGPKSGPDFFDDQPPPPRPPGGEFPGAPDQHGRGGFGGPRDRGRPPREGPGSLRDVGQRTIRRIVSALTPAQQAKWQELVGAPYEHDLPWRFE
jgi:eukaryotic-like serine/threonine-protein kinase